MNDLINEKFEFIDNICSKEPRLTIIKEKDCFKFKIVFELENKCFTETTKNLNFKKGISHLKNKTQKTIDNYFHKSYNKDTIRKMVPIKPDTEKEPDLKCHIIESIDKPMTEEDIKQFMFQNRLNIVMFINSNKDEYLCIMKRDKDKFDLYISDYSM